MQKKIENILVNKKILKNVQKIIVDYSNCTFIIEKNMQTI